MGIIEILMYAGFGCLLLLVLFMGWQVGSQLYKRKKKTGRLKK